MKVIIADGFDYIPIWRGNRKVDKKDQIKVHFTFLSGETFASTIDDNGKVDKLKEWLSMCDKIENLNINKIDVTPEGVYNIPGLMDLFIELKLAYNKETIIDKKK